MYIAFSNYGDLFVANDDDVSHLPFTHLIDVSQLPSVHVPFAHAPFIQVKDWLPPLVWFIMLVIIWAFAWRC
jgi:hypothetical protein